MSFAATLIDMGEAVYDLARDQSGWSQATFGTDAERGPLGALMHLEKESREAQAAARLIDDCRANGRSGNPIDITPAPGFEPSPLYWELADCLLLLLDAARRSGLGPLELVRAAQRKMEVNKARRWPEYDPARADGPVEHLKPPPG